MTYLPPFRAFLSKEDDTFVLLSSILEPMTFQTDIRLALEPVSSDVQTDITCTLEKVKCSMSPKDLQVVLSSMKANWSEGAPANDPRMVLFLALNRTFMLYRICRSYVQMLF